jgi:uncharacterized membrane protein
MGIRNPIEWGVDQVKGAGATLGSLRREMRDADAAPQRSPLSINRIDTNDIRAALAQGLQDFAANRTDVLFVCVVYPILGLVFGRMASGYDMLPLLFPLASGFALVGPFAAIGLYAMSREREQGKSGGIAAAFGVFQSPAIGSMVLLGLILVAILVLWLAAAMGIYDMTLGPESPASLSAFTHDVLTTGAGWALIVLGFGVGFLFAVLVLAISFVSFPLMLDRNVGLETAVWTSMRAAAANPAMTALWGLLVAGGLVIGSIPLFLGLIVVMPVLGHGTWHLYRRLIPR